MLTASEIGERRHEQCRYGVFAQHAVSIPAEGGRAVPFAMPLCGFAPPEPFPPELKRVWGGDIDFARDCSVCAAYSPVTE